MEVTCPRTRHWAKVPDECPGEFDAMMRTHDQEVWTGEVCKIGNTWLSDADIPPALLIVNQAGTGQLWFGCITNIDFNAPIHASTFVFWIKSFCVKCDDEVLTLKSVPPISAV